MNIHGGIGLILWSGLIAGQACECDMEALLPVSAMSGQEEITMNDCSDRYDSGADRSWRGCMQITGKELRDSTWVVT